MSFQVRRTAPLLVVMLLVIPLLLVGCSRGDSSTQDADAMAWKIDPSPPKVGSTTITFQPFDDNSQPLTGASLSIEGNMSHAGMMPVTSGLTETEPGTYVSSDFAFSMAGDWIMTVRGTLDDGTSYEATFDVEGVEA